MCCMHRPSIRWDLCFVLLLPQYYDCRMRVQYCGKEYTAHSATMDHFKIVTVVTLIIYCLESSLSQQVICTDTVTFERGERGIVSCQYDRNFIAVFWYRDQADNPFLRLEGGRSTPAEGFTIEPDGTMTIESVQIEDEGEYRISVLDQNGASLSDRVRVEVTVSLSTDPVIQRCSISELNICDEIEEEHKENVLVCQTTDTRPDITFQWSLIGSSGLDELFSNTTMNITTKLFTSSSILQFFPNKFSLQYFTCEATGEAVKEQRSSSLFVEGQRQVAATIRNTEMIKGGSTLQLKCSEVNQPLLTWTFIQHDTTYITLKRSYPDENEGPCLFGDNCYVDNNGILTINYVTHRNEGSYECLYSDGDTSWKSANKIDIIIKPMPEEIVIEGCKNNSKCDKAVALTGTIEASAFRARPSIELTCEVADASTSFIFNHQIQVQDHPEDGTFDTFYSVDFDIDECSAPVHIKCMVISGSVHEMLPVSNIFLITDNSSCDKGKPWLAAILVILFVIFLVIATIVIYIKREKETYTAVRQADQVEGNNTPAAVTSLKAATQLKGNEDTTLKQDEFDNRFAALYEQLKKNEINKENFHQQMDQFSKTKDKNLPQLFLTFVTDEDLYEDKAWAVLKLISTFVPYSELSCLEFARKLAQLVKEKKLAVDKFLNVAEEFYTKRKIPMETYVEITGPLVRSNTISLNTIMKELANFEKQQVDKLELAKGLLLYSNYSEKSDDIEALQKAYRESKLLPYPYVLQSLYRHIEQVDATDRYFTWFKDIISTHLQGKLQTRLDTLIGDKEKLQTGLDSLNDNKEKLQTGLDSLNDDEEKLQTGLDSLNDDKEKLQTGLDSLNDDKEKLQTGLDSLKDDKEKLPTGLDSLNNDKEKLHTDLDSLRYDKMFSEIFVESLCLSVTAKTINASECVDLLLKTCKVHTSHDKDDDNTKNGGRTIKYEDIQEVLQNISSKATISWRAASDIFYYSLEKMLIEDSFYLTRMEILREKLKINLKDYIDEIKRCLKPKQISQQLFEDALTKHIDKDEWKKEDWVNLFVELFKADMIGKSVKERLFRCITKKHKVTEKQLREMVQKTELSQKQRNAILQGVKVYALSGDHYIK